MDQASFMKKGTWKKHGRLEVEDEDECRRKLDEKRKKMQKEHQLHEWSKRRNDLMLQHQKVQENVMESRADIGCKRKMEKRRNNLMLSTKRCRRGHKRCKTSKTER